MCIIKVIQLRRRPKRCKLLKLLIKHRINSIKNRSINVSFPLGPHGRRDNAELTIGLGQIFSVLARYGTVSGRFVGFVPVHHSFVWTH